MTIYIRPELSLDSIMLEHYFTTLIDLIFKVLPLWEDGEESLGVYMQGLQVEILGCSSLLAATNFDPMLMSIAARLQYLIDNPDCDISVVKREVFGSISICNKLKRKYSSKGAVRNK